ncbi:MAG: HAMP domain-containing protein [Deltaproteobacteria bacterium]|nr:MAG: HAMP domain-containing protein [Deltaproteobacteria bacterium]
MEPRDRQQAASSPALSSQPEAGRGSSSRSRILRAATGLSLKLGIASAVVVSLVIGTGAFFAYRGEKQQLLAGMTRAASAQGRLVLTGLKAAMLDNNRTLLLDLIEEYGRSEGVERIYIVDATGGVALTTEPSWIGRSLELPSDVCPTCPLPPGAPLTRTSITEEGGVSIMRSMMLIRNENRCHRCHPAEQAILGGLGVDFSMAAIDEARAAIVSRTLRWGTAVCILVLLAVGAVVQLGALRRLRRLRDAARALPAAVDTEPPAKRPAAGDEIRELERTFENVSFSLARSMAEVDHQRQFLIDLIDRVDDGVAVFDTSLDVVAANKSYLERVARAGDVPALSCADGPACLLHENGITECPTRRAFRTGTLEKGMHKRTADGSTVSYEVFASPIAGDDGTVSHVVEVWRDVSERMALEANLAHSEQLATVGVLASGFSHEIATPLGTVATSIQGILRRIDGKDRLDAGEIAALRSRLEVAAGEVFRCRNVMRSLLDLSRRRRSVAESLDLAGLVRRMLDVVRPTADERGVTLEYRQDCAEEVVVVGHSEQLEQVALNLFVNAIEAMPDGGRLTVALTAANGRVDWKVEDTGIGVPAEDQPHVFDPFFSRKKGGTGLGLYVTKQIIESHGGRIEVARSSPSGTVLHVSLPRASQPPPEAA